MVFTHKNRDRYPDWEIFFFRITPGGVYFGSIPNGSFKSKFRKYCMDNIKNCIYVDYAQQIT